MEASSKRPSALHAEIRSFTYRDAGKRSLEGLSLEVKPGSITVLTGLSGCGKTTLLRIACRLFPDYFEGELAGRVAVLGKNTEDYLPGELSTKLGLVFQDPRSQFLSAQVEDEIALTGENLGIPSEQLRERIEGILEQLGISHLRDRSVYELSGGERQKVAIAGILVSEPELIILDEPSASLDHRSTLQLARLIEKLRDQGKTLLVAEHRLFYLAPLLDELAVMRDGALEGVYGPGELQEPLRRRLGLRAFDERLLHAGKPPAQGEARESVENLDVTLRIGPFARRKLLESVGFELAQGEVMAIVGTNGVGKTTLARQLCGLGRRDTGRVSWGRSRRERNDASYYVMQDASNQIFFESVEEELLQGRRDAATISRAKELLIEVDLWDKRLEHPQHLSGGEQQRLVVACALMEPHRIVVFDEPTAGLDLVRMKSLAALIERCARESSVIVVTHDSELVFSICNSCLLCSPHGTKKLNTCGNEGRILDFMGGQA